MSRYDQDRMASRMIRLEEQLRQRPIRTAIRGGAGQPYYQLQVGGGNALTTGQIGIIYNPAYNAVTGPFPSAAWNPLLMPSGMDTGLGWGYLYINGAMQTAQVLIWNNNPGIPYTALSGRRFRGVGTTVLPVGSAGGAPLTFWLPDWG